MQKTVAAKLIPSKTQAQALKSTLAVFAANSFAVSIFGLSPIPKA
jgi:hypothetical protein